MEIQTGTIAGPRLSQVNFGLLAALTPTDIVAARVTASTNYVEASVREPNTNGKSRHPVYLPHGPSVRIVSRPCGAWRVERRVGEEGTREVDCWEPVSHDTSKDAAFQRMLSITKLPL